MSKFKAACSAASSYIVCFFKQTFRRHTGREYSQFLTRGIRRGEEGVQRAYPWFYIRLFAACVIVFAVYLLILRFTSNALFSPVVVILAALTFNVSFLVLLYEIYPRDDLSLLSVFITLLVGGTGACVLAQIMYMYIPASNGWLAALRAAGVEELSKAVPVVIVVLSLKIRQPLVGFIMGAAVGCGFSVVEDAGYIFVAANDLPALNIPSVVATFFERGATSFCTHTVWTASVGWALACARRSLSAARPFVCLAGAFAETVPLVERVEGDVVAAPQNLVDVGIRVDRSVGVGLAAVLFQDEAGFGGRTGRGAVGVFAENREDAPHGAGLQGDDDLCAGCVTYFVNHGQVAQE